MFCSKKKKAMIEEQVRADQLAIAQADREERKKQMSKILMMRIMGVSIISAMTLILATKKLFDEIFVEDDWSNVDWGEEEDFGVDID